ncbi:proline-rich receptor-like protein kinase PERK12 [Iris pallida]|uniref:Proline-rich receptor-like protein kinase PERK12 n=1 Tax=Iris pallida TaxID=29817 RepID=A0AAX6DYX8_IRIPA|nr:proline-rich receptor-like protein kinase PERK12 [Iris pallida]
MFEVPSQDARHEGAHELYFPQLQPLFVVVTM